MRSVLLPTRSTCGIIGAMSRRKSHQHGPRRKRMTRQARLRSAKHTRWVEQYTGKNIVESYRKWFAVDPLCAVLELRMLGVSIPGEIENRAKEFSQARAKAKQSRRQSAAQCELDETLTDSDEMFAYIAGYTPGGVPYGVTWDEFGERPPWEEDDDEGLELPRG